ncbi:MAG: polysaccharide deacetylase family protein [Clostridia bacterium]|nr:polysaccharide deacetylase family protein [Clostridia bacterium]
MSIFLRFPGGKFKALTLSYDDAVTADIKLIEILNKYGIKATFNISSCFFAKDDNGHYLSRETALKLYSLYGHEPAIHTATHRFITELPTAVAMDEVVNDKKALEKMFGKIITGGAYPFGDNDNKIEEIMRYAGLKYCRALQRRYCHNLEKPIPHRFDMPVNWLRWLPSCHHNDPLLMEMARQFVDMKIDKSFKWGTKPKLFALWGHSYEFNDDNNWEVIEKFAEFIGGKDDIWYATNGEICEYDECFKRLEFSTDGSIVKNPTYRTVWVAVDNNEYKIEAGEIIRVERDEEFIGG